MGFRSAIIKEERRVILLDELRRYWGNISIDEGKNTRPNKKRARRTRLTRVLRNKTINTVSK